MTVNIYTNEQSFKSQFVRQSFSFSKLNDTKNQTLKEMSPPFVHILSVSKYIFYMLYFPMKIIIQGRHNFSKTEGAAQKVGGQNIKSDLTFNIFGVKFQGK